MGSFNPPKKSSSTAVLKFSFLSNDGDDETEEYHIQMKDFPQGFKSSKQDSFRTELRDIGKPKQIRLIMEVNGQEKNEDIKWHLDHVNISQSNSNHHSLSFRSK
jgi:PLAT/LH2 domain